MQDEVTFEALVRELLGTGRLIACEGAQSPVYDVTYRGSHNEFYFRKSQLEAAGLEPVETTNKDGDFVLRLSGEGAVRVHQVVTALPKPTPVLSTDQQSQLRRMLTGIYKDGRLTTGADSKGAYIRLAGEESLGIMQQNLKGFGVFSQQEGGSLFVRDPASVQLLMPYVTWLHNSPQTKVHSTQKIVDAAAQTSPATPLSTEEIKAVEAAIRRKFKAGQCLETRTWLTGYVDPMTRQVILGSEAELATLGEQMARLPVPVSTELKPTRDLQGMPIFNLVITGGIGEYVRILANDPLALKYSHRDGLAANDGLASKSKQL